MTMFSKQADIYLAAIASRKRDPVKATSLATIRSLIRAALPVLGKLKIEDIRSGELKTLAEVLDQEKYSPNTIQSVLTTVKMIIASDVDANGDPKHPRNWNNEFIDAPPAKSKEVIPPTADRIELALACSESPTREFIATQAATGCRLGELLALNVSDFDSVRGLLRVSRTRSRHGETDTKTNAGKREVDLHPDISAILTAMLAGRDSGRLFSVTIDSVRWAYGRLEIKSHSLRHFRYTLLQKSKIHPAIHAYWIGHSVKGMAAIYGHIQDDIELRQRLVREVGLGFSLPAHAAPQTASSRPEVSAIA